MWVPPGLGKNSDRGHLHSKWHLTRPPNLIKQMSKNWSQFHAEGFIKEGRIAVWTGGFLKLEPNMPTITSERVMGQLNSSA